MEPRRAGRPADYTGLDPETVHSLEFLGRSALEIKVYLSILEHPRVRVPDIARLSYVPQPKVYSTIKRLIGRGLIENELGPVNRYSVIDPKHGFRPLLDEVGQREGSARTIIGALSRDYASNSDRETSSAGRVKLFQSRAAASRSFRDRLTRVEKDLVIVVRWPLVLSDYSPDISGIIGKGGSVRMLLEIPGKLKDDHVAFSAPMREAGAKIRYLPAVPMRMAVFDVESVALPMNDPAPHEGDGFMMLEVRNPEMSLGFQMLFDKLWEEGKDL